MPFQVEIFLFRRFYATTYLFSSMYHRLHWPLFTQLPNSKQIIFEMQAVRPHQHAFSCTYILHIYDIITIHTFIR